MVRIAVVLLLLAGVAGAQSGYGSWQAERWGQNPATSRLPADAGSGGNHVEAHAGATAGLVDAYLHTTMTTADQEGTASDQSTAWFGLRFVGSTNARNHHWKITTKIRGFGWAYADSTLEASSWGESLQVISVSGDNTNSDGGQLAVQDNAEVSLSISIPDSVRISILKSARALTRDEFKTANDVCTKGSGKCCRVRVDNQATAKGAAESTLQVAAVWIKAHLDAEIEMVGYCTFDGVEVTDRFVLTDDDDDGTTAEVTEPSGGLVAGSGGVPTDQPKEEEREGEDTTDRSVDARDLEKLLPHDFEDEPPVDSGADVEGD